MLPILERLPQGLARLEDAYDKALKQIDEQVESYRLLARRVISWITLARRMLTIPELCHAVSIDVGDTSLEAEDVHEVELLTSICAGLVAVDEDRGIIRLVQYTSQHYFEQVLATWHPDGQKEVAETCLTYLAFNTFRGGPCPDIDAFEQRLADNVLYSYSAHHWQEHLQPVQSAVAQTALTFLGDTALTETIAQADGLYNHIWPGYTTGLHLVAEHGLSVLTKEILLRMDSTTFSSSTGSYSHHKDSSGFTPLLHALHI